MGWSATHSAQESRGVLLISMSKDLASHFKSEHWGFLSSKGGYARPRTCSAVEQTFCLSLVDPSIQNVT